MTSGVEDKGDIKEELRKQLRFARQIEHWSGVCGAASAAALVASTIYGIWTGDWRPLMTSLVLLAAAAGLFLLTRDVIKDYVREIGQ